MTGPSSNRWTRLWDAALRRLSASWRARRKYEEELRFWNQQLQQLEGWYGGTIQDWWGLAAPRPEQRHTQSRSRAMNAILTAHALRPAYLEQLQLPATAFAGQRVLEVGCGPMAPILQFAECHRFGLDPLTQLYQQAGWPLDECDVTFLNAPAEAIPVASRTFNAVISVNALDHVDDFRRTAQEIQRVLRPNGGLYFEIEYHAPTVTEPQALNDHLVQSAFDQCRLKKVCERNKRDLFAQLGSRTDLVSPHDTLVVWHGTKEP